MSSLRKRVAGSTAVSASMSNSDVLPIGPSQLT